LPDSQKEYVLNKRKWRQNTSPETSGFLSGTTKAHTITRLLKVWR